MCDLVLGQLQGCRDNQPAFGFLELRNVGVFLWPDQYLTSLCFNRKWAEFVNGAEAVIFSKRR